MPRVIHDKPDERAAPLCEELVRRPAVQAVIFGGSRYTGGWDEESDLDVVIILEESGDEAESRRTVGRELAGLKERYYPGYTDWRHPDHGVEHGEWIVSMEYFLRHRRTVNHPMAQAAKQGMIITRKPGDMENTGTTGTPPTSGSWSPWESSGEQCPNTGESRR